MWLTLFLLLFLLLFVFFVSVYLFFIVVFVSSVFLPGDDDVFCWILSRRFRSVCFPFFSSTVFPAGLGLVPSIL